MNLFLKFYYSFLYYLYLLILLSYNDSLFDFFIFMVLGYLLVVLII